MSSVFRLFDLVEEADRISRLQASLVTDTIERVSRLHPHYRELIRQLDLR